MECFAFFLFVLLAIAFGWLYRVSRRFRATEVKLSELGREVSLLRRTLVPGTVADVPRASAEATAEGKAAGREVAGEDVVTVEPETSPRKLVPPPAAEPERPPPAVEPPAAGETVPPQPPAGEPTPAAEPRPRIEWERWIGVRGAAVAGAVVLGLAGMLFLKYSIEHGLVPPPVRVAAVLLAGLGCLVGSEGLRRRKRGYDATANALASAGVVLLYGAVWAARTLYELIGSGFALVLMVLVTIACGALTWRYDSRVIAIIGLAGGFATPALLSTGEDRPISLFGYLLLLNLGVLALAVRRGWSFLAGLSLGLTSFYQIFWVLGRMGSERVFLGLTVLAVFAGLYAVAGRHAAADPARPPGWRRTQAAAVLIPFALTFYFAGDAELGPRLVPMAALLLLLSLLARWIAGLGDRPLFGVAAAAASVAAVTVWCLRTTFDTALAWEGVACGVVLAAAFHLFWELDLRRDRSAGRGGFGERVSAAGFLLLFAGAPLTLREPSPWPWLAGWTVLAILLWRQSVLARGRALPVLASLAVGTGAGAYFLVHGRPQVLLFAVAAAVVCQVAARWRRDPQGRRSSEAAAAVLPLVLLILLMAEAARPTLAPWAFYATTLSAAALVALAATRLRSGGFYFAAMAALAWDHWRWTLAIEPSGALAPGADTVLLGFAAQALAVVAFTAWPFAADAALAARPWVLYAAALAGPAWFPSLRRLFVLAFSDTAIGLLPVALAGLALGALAWCRRQRTTEAFDRSRMAWFGAVALIFLSVAIPLQLEKEWITVGWALQGFAVLLLWKRLDHCGLKYFGLSLLFAASVRLVVNPAVLAYYPRDGGWPVLNWLLYTYLVPAAAMVLSARLLAPLELSRRRDWEQPLYARGWPIAAGACSLMAITVVFVWINLTIFDAFSAGAQLHVSLDRLPARDLTMSLAWAAYALALLAIGMAGGLRPLRWISLAFLVLTLGKVFLYDLGELKDLYRVASLVGLAVSLLAVSLAYQRFVFGRRAPGDEDP